MVTPKEKGDALEAAVAAIEEEILKKSPASAAKPRVEKKKIIEVGGVRHEIDVYITIVLAGKEFWKVNDDNWAAGPEKSAGPLVQFTNGRLSFTERYWATGENDTALFGAVNSLNKDGFRSCELTAGVNTTPDATSHNVWIVCGEKSVVVIRSTMYNKTYIMVHEQLGTQHDIK